MIENLLIAVTEIAMLYALHVHFKSIHASKKRAKLKAKLRGCL